MRNNIISLEKCFSIFAYLSVVRLQAIWAKSNASTLTADRIDNWITEKYLCKEIILFLIYFGIYFLADKGKCEPTLS